MIENPIHTVSDTFGMVIMQPTTLCKLDRSYCYLPDRRTQRLMPVPVAARVAQSVADQNRPCTVDGVWHAGEPS